MIAMNTENWGEFVLRDLFKIVSGNGFDLNKMTSDTKERVAFVTRSAKNNGVGGYVDIVDGVEPFPAGDISVALGGSIGSTFVQVTPFYTGEHQVVLKPIVPMTIEQKLFIASIIQFEAQTNYTAFGRELDRYIRTTFKIKLPVLDDNQPDFEAISNIMRSLPSFSHYYTDDLMTVDDITKSISDGISCKEIEEDKKWKKFVVSDLFTIKAGYYSKKPTQNTRGERYIPFVSATQYNNGVSEWHTLADIEESGRLGDNKPNESIDDKIFKGNCLVVANDGSVGEAHYMPIDFVSNIAVSALYPKGEWKMNEHVGLFLCGVFGAEKFRFSYGRKYKIDRMSKSTIWLPVDDNSQPDWKYMEDFIKSMKH
jgi:hypothetical protein